MEASRLRRATRAACILAAVMSAALHGPVAAQQATYEGDQADIGVGIYQNVCASCHMPTLQGAGDAPGLAGPGFRSTWGSRPVADLLRYVSTTMPQTAPGSLTEEQYAAVVAHIMRQNGVQPGERALSLASTGTVLASALVAALYAAPGRPGNVPSPNALNAPPEIVGDVVETSSGRTMTLRPAQRYRDASQAELDNPAPADWPHWRRGPHSLGYTPLSQINTENVHRLQLAWVWGMELEESSQPAPIVRSGVIYIPDAGNVIQAVEAATGTLLWEYRRKFPEGYGGGSRGQNRTLALWEDLVFVATRDAWLVALDARTGKVRWETRVADYKQGFTNSSGPIVAGGKVINGINGCNRLIEESCFITAHDARTGNELWRTFTIARPGEPGGDTWGDLPFAMRGGGDVWNGGSYDPELGLVYWGTAQAKPYLAASKGLTWQDSTLYANSTLALDVDDGHIVWYRTHVPGESLDMDEAMEQVLADVDGVPALFEMGKHGILHNAIYVFKLGEP